MKQKIKVYMGILSTGHREDIHTYLFRNLERMYGDEIEMVFPEQCCHRFGHDFARNEVVEEFLNTDCDYLWFLDSDVCPPNNIFDLLTLHKDKNWLAAGAPYPLWMQVPGSDITSIVFTAYKEVVKSGDKKTGIRMAEVPTTGTEWIDGLATGCLFLKREVFEKLEKPYFQFKRDPQSMQVIEGEDLGFALKLSSLGIKFFCDHGMVCKHYKKVCLLDMNNYATEMSNAKLLDYDAEIRNQIGAAMKAASEEGYRRGKADAEITKFNIQSSEINRTKSGLIVPESYARK